MIDYEIWKKNKINKILIWGIKGKFIRIEYCFILWWIGCRFVSLLWL